MKTDKPNPDAVCHLCGHARRFHAVVGIWCAKCGAKCDGKYGDPT